jgi:SpoVK/Ycf46/Vps4 family AAA+-type ATPase
MNICNLLLACPVISTRIGQKVQIEAFPNIKFAKSVQISAFEDSLLSKGGGGGDRSSEDLFGAFLKPHFLDQYLPMRLGQTFSCQEGGGVAAGDTEEEEEEEGDDDVGRSKGSKDRVVEFKITSIETFEEDDENDENDDFDSKDDAAMIKKKTKSALNLGDYCVIGPDTEVVLDSDVLARDDEDSLLDISYEDIGGCGSQLSKIREVLELPLRHPELFRTLGISPPRGVLMHGPPGVFMFI